MCCGGSEGQVRARGSLRDAGDHAVLHGALGFGSRRRWEKDLQAREIADVQK